MRLALLDFQDFFHFLYLQVESLIGIHASFLEQEVMYLLQGLELKVVLYHFATIQQRLDGNIELDATSQSLFVLAEDHVH